MSSIDFKIVVVFQKPKQTVATESKQLLWQELPKPTIADTTDKTEIVDKESTRDREG